MIARPTEAAVAAAASSPVAAALEALRGGRPLLLREPGAGGERGHLVIAAEGAGTPQLAFLLRHGAGVAFAVLGAEAAARLAVEPAAAGDRASAPFAVSTALDWRGAADPAALAGRAATLRALAEPEASAKAFLRPGHLLAVRADRGQLVGPAAAPAAAVELVRAAGLGAVAAVAPLLGEDGERLGAEELQGFAARWELPAVGVEDVVRHLLRGEPLAERLVEADLPTPFGRFRCVAWESELDRAVHLALLLGDLGAGEPPLVRVHSECRGGDIFRSRLCRCGPSLARSLERISDEGRGAVVYLRAPEEAGASRVHQLLALAAGEPDQLHCEEHDERELALAAQVLRQLGIERMRLLGDGAAGGGAVDRCGIEIVERVPLDLAVGA